MFSRAIVNGEPYEVNEHTSPAIRQFLLQALSNNRYDSVEQLQHRAEVYLEHIDAEKKLIDEAGTALRNTESPACRPSTWMAHLERGLWNSETLSADLDGPRLANEVLGIAEPVLWSPDYDQRPRISSPAQSALAMMVKAEAGPFTKEQSLAAFEVLQEVQLIAKQLGHEERAAYRAENRHDAKRSGTHQSRTPGADLSQDIGTHVRDGLGVPVMGGTSGSSSDVALATKYGAQQAGVSWAAPGLSEDEAKAAMVDIALHFFRSEGSNPPTLLAKSMNRVRSSLGLPAKGVEASQVFAHSYAEIHAAVSLTLDGLAPADKAAVMDALRQYTIEAKERLTSGATPEQAVSMPATPPV